MKRKLKIEELKVQSFITSLNDDVASKLKGGTLTDTIGFGGACSNGSNGMECAVTSPDQGCNGVQTDPSLCGNGGGSGGVNACWSGPTDVGCGC